MFYEELTHYVMTTYICELGEWNLVLSLTMAVIVYCLVVGDELLLTRTRSSTSRTSSSVAWILEKHITDQLQSGFNYVKT